jgi:mannose-6-phosphate isomerase-like protein (cupin superfamily)
MADFSALQIDETEAIFGGAFHRVRASLGVSSFGMQVIQMAPGADFYPNHDHAETGQEEVYVVLDGSAEFDIEGEHVSAVRDTAVRVGPQTKRTIAPGPDGVRLLCLGAIPGQPYSPPQWSELGGPLPGLPQS